MTDLTDTPIPLDLYDPVELLSFVPYQFGFHLTDSFVILTSRREQGKKRLGFLARVDTSVLLEPNLARRTRTSMRERLDAQATREGFLILYDEHLFDALSSGPRGDTRQEGRVTRLLTEIARWFDDSRFDPERTYIVSRERWRCLACAVPGHCASNGQPASVLAHSTIAAWMVLNGRQVAPSRDHLIVLPDAPPAGSVTEPVRRELNQIHRRMGRAPSFAWERMTMRKWTRALEVLARAERAEGDASVPLRPPELSLLGLSLHTTTIRDNVIYAACTGAAIPMVGTDAHFTRLFDRSGPPPSAHIYRYLDLLHAAARHCPSGARAPVLTTWAWCNWWVGNGAEANILVDLARETDPDYSLAQTLASVLHRNLLPPWMAAATPT